MSTGVQERSGLPADALSAIHRPRLPRWAPLLVAAFAIAAGALVALSLGGGAVATVVLAAIIFIVALPSWSAVVENRRAAVDRLVTSLVWGCTAIAVIPLLSMLYEVIRQGASVMNAKFFTWSMRNVIEGQGGIYHALIGTLLVTFFATLISVPIGILAAVYTVEYGGENRLVKAIRFLTDVMTGIPSIVAGLFAYALFGLLFGVGFQAAISGSVALSVLMIPIVVRSTEEMLKLVPSDLREASYALGVPKWRTIVKVVLPTAIAGIITGITLSIARVIGETAPILIACGATDSVNLNPFSQSTETLPVFIYYAYTQPGLNHELQTMAWGGALVLVLIVLILNVLARILGAVFAPKKTSR